MHDLLGAHLMAAYTVTVGVAGGFAELTAHYYTLTSFKQLSLYLYIIFYTLL
jgi:hypothetical protein